MALKLGGTTAEVSSIRASHTVVYTCNPLLHLRPLGHVVRRMAFRLFHPRSDLLSTDVTSFSTSSLLQFNHEATIEAEIAFPTVDAHLAYPFIFHLSSFIFHLSSFIFHLSSTGNPTLFLTPTNFPFTTRSHPLASL